MIKRLFLFVAILFVLVIPISFAWAKPVNYNEVSIRFYDDKINKEDCFKTFDKIPKEYFEGMQYINIYSEKLSQTLLKQTMWTSSLDSVSYSGDGVIGYYYWGWNKIELFNKCEINNVVHELAHHKNYIDGFTFEETNAHDDIFYNAEAEIWENIN